MQARVVANLPYNISTAILQRLIEQRACLTELVLMLQREVVERITAPPATSARGFLSVLVEAYCEAETLFDVAADAFNPVPKVWSTVVRLRVRQPAALTSPTNNFCGASSAQGSLSGARPSSIIYATLPLMCFRELCAAGGAERALESGRY